MGPVATASTELERAQEKLKRAKTEDEAKIANREMFETMARVQAAYNGPGNWPAGAEAPVEPFPRSASMPLQKLIELLIVGVIPKQVKDLAGPGQLERGPGEKRAIQWACRYVRAAHAGEIDDPHAVQTIAGFYGVRRQTVDGWMKTNLADEPMDQYATFPDEQRAEIIKKRAHEEGLYYRRHGRGIAMAFHAKQAKERP